MWIHVVSKVSIAPNLIGRCCKSSLLWPLEQTTPEPRPKTKSMGPKHGRVGEWTLDDSGRLKLTVAYKKEAC